MSENLRHWSVLSKTDPKHTKEFQRAGGFRGTAIKPIYAYQKMTEHFGPCGDGWGMEKPEFTTQVVGDEILVFCTVAVWYADANQPETVHVGRGDVGPALRNASAFVYGVGGDKVTLKRKDGSIAADDEAFKKAYTDALTNALVKIGVSADVHMGMFEDNKYVSALRKEFAEEAAPARASTVPPQSPTTVMGPQNGADHADHKTLAAGIRDALTGAETLDRLQIIMDLNRATIGTLPQVTANYLEGIYHKRKAAMESVT